MTLSPFAALINGKRVIVCCGAGGVGKTTVSSSVALSAARTGLRVVAITVDPSRRLAEALGVQGNLDQPTPVSVERLRGVGVVPPGSLSVWLLDPQRVCDRVVQTVSPNEAARRQLLGNRLYQNVSALVAGMHEYTAVEALHGFLRDDRYDLIVLDTPPSKNALRFLETPSRANSFLDPRIMNFFIPSQDSALHRVGAKLINKILDLGLGQKSREELQEFLSLFQNVLRHLNRNQEDMRRFFASPAASFLLVTSPAQAAFDETQSFARRAQELGLSIGGIVLNQTQAESSSLALPEDPLGPAAPAAAQVALHHLLGLAILEDSAAAHDRALGTALRTWLDPKLPLWTLPRLAQDDADLGALGQLADRLSRHEDGAC